jgi:hypothetical protein
MTAAVRKTSIICRIAADALVRIKVTAAEEVNIQEQGEFFRR